MNILMTIFEYNYSPLDQFDNVNWIIYNFFSESIDVYNLYSFELEYNIFSIWENNGNFIQYFFHKNNTIFLILLLFIFLLTFVGYIIFKYENELKNIYFKKVYILYLIYTYFYTSIVKNYIREIGISFLFLLTFFHIFTGFILFAWFDDFIFTSWSVNKESLQLLNNWFLNSNTISISSENIDYLFLPQINLGIIFDENFISFLIGFFLLGGAEEEEDEDFLLEEEESDFIEDIVAPLFLTNLGKDIEDNGALFLKVCSIFGFVLFNNLMGMIPYSNTATSSLILTFWVSLSVFGSLMFLMIRKHGVNYFFNLFMPAGTSLGLMFLLIPIEFISYTFRLVSLSVRLFINMFAGHTLIKVILGFSWSMILIGDVFLLINLFPIALLFILTCLDIAVAIVQAYIFTTLTCIYLKDIFVAH